MKNETTFNAKQFLAENSNALKAERESVPACIQILSLRDKKLLADHFELSLASEFLHEDIPFINRVIWQTIRQRREELFFVNRSAKFRDIHFAENGAVAQATIALSTLSAGEVAQLSEIEVFQLNEAIACAFDAMKIAQEIAELAKARFADR